MATTYGILILHFVVIIIVLINEGIAPIYASLQLTPDPNAYSISITQIESFIKKIAYDYSTNVNWLPYTPSDPTSANLIITYNGVKINGWDLYPALNSPNNADLLTQLDTFLGQLNEEKKNLDVYARAAFQKGVGGLA